MRLNTGKMDREIVVLTVIRSQAEGTGEDVTTWPDVASVEDAEGVDNATVVSAQWLPAGTREAWQAQQRLGSFVSGVFRIRDVNPRPTAAGTRILFDGDIYDVTGVIEIGRGEGWELSVTARAD